MGGSPRAPVETGVTFSSREVGPYIWHEFDADRTRDELRAIADAGLRSLRVHLLWDAFMPTARRVEPARLRDLDRFLDAASAAAVRVTPVVFAQTFGDCIMLPTWAIDVAGARAGVRAVCDAVVQPGGPRDLYTDPLMLDASARWLDALLSAFSGHPALALWDLGHDPATTMRPRRIEHLRAWVGGVAARVHERDERCTLTLGTRDVTTARAVRPALVAESVDVVGIDLAGIDAAGIAAESDIDASIFIAQLMQALSGTAHIAADVAITRDLEAPEMRRDTEAVFDGLVDVGCETLSAPAWSAPGPRVTAVAPFDRSEAPAAIVDAEGRTTSFGAAWLDEAAREHERRPPAPWPSEIDGDSFYANLPESLLDLHVAWRRGTDDRPATLR